MKLQTPVADLPCKVGISYKDSIMMLGSCFADNVGSRLRDCRFKVMVNPFGTLYNPKSLLGSVRRLVSGEHFTEADCVQMGAGAGLVCSFSHHTTFARESAREFLEGANKALDEASAFFRECDKVVITLGTSWCYRYLESGLVVSNCLKRPAREFARERMSVEEVADCLRGMMEICEAAEGSGSRHKDFIFTVSPIRHLADGAHGNQLSKATLLLGIEQVLEQAEGQAGQGCADYFPSYEIMMDELRGYRFYAEDMCHPTAQAEEYICSRFLGWALPAGEQQVLEENIRLLRRSRHIPQQQRHPSDR
ncbi:MAG: GSCFA domain-containing protein [Candidatus Cryptobacteroides sp.]